jgi:hypothetical protein
MKRGESLILKKFVFRVPNFEEVTNWVSNIERPSNWVPNFQISLGLLVQNEFLQLLISGEADPFEGAFGASRRSKSSKSSPNRADGLRCHHQLTLVKFWPG